MKWKSTARFALCVSSPLVGDLYTTSNCFSRSSTFTSRHSSVNAFVYSICFAIYLISRFEMPLPHVLPLSGREQLAEPIQSRIIPSRACHLHCWGLDRCRSNYSLHGICGLTLSGSDKCRIYVHQACSLTPLRVVLQMHESLNCPQ